MSAQIVQNQKHFPVGVLDQGGQKLDEFVGICDRRPEQLKMDFALWSRPAVKQLIERKYGLALSVRAIGNYLLIRPANSIKRDTSRESPENTF